MRSSTTRTFPDDIGTVRSAWVTAPTAMADPAQIGRDYHMYLRLMQGADRVGWDSLLLNEHHQTWHAMTPSPNLIAAVLASTTESAAIAICGNSLALYNPPMRVAEELAMLDCLSGGRLIAGMVFGTPMDSAFSYGTPPAELRERFYEARELILRAWKAEEPFTFNGKLHQAPLRQSVAPSGPGRICRSGSPGPGASRPGTWSTVRLLLRLPVLLRASRRRRRS